MLANAERLAQKRLDAQHSAVRGQVVAVPSIPAHKRLVPDGVIATYLPEQAASTVGMTGVHFFSRVEADAYKRMHIEN